MSSAHRFAAGDLTARTRISRRDEIGELARILDRSADQLQARLNELAGERARTETILSAIDSGLLAVDHRGTVILANQSLRRSLDLPDPLGRHYVEVIRHPDVGRALEAALRTGRPQALEVRIHHLRRVYALQAGPFPGQEGHAARSGADVPGRDGAPARGRGAAGLRRQRVPRAAHAAHVHPRLRGGAGGRRPGGAAHRAALPGEDPHPPPTAWPRSSRTCSSCRAWNRARGRRRGSAWRRRRSWTRSSPPWPRWPRPSRSRSPRSVEAPPFETDRDRLRGVLENLVENALKYTPPGGHVSVSARAGRRRRRVRGGGRRARHRGRSTSRACSSASTGWTRRAAASSAGTGLGLSIVKHLVESLGGSVSVTSEPGRGSRFTVRLPMARREPARSA